MSALAFLHCGGETPRPLELRAGPLTMRFEPATAFLRHLRLGDHEVVRALYAAVRDHNWATITPHFDNLVTEIGLESFRLSFDAACRRGDVEYFWRGTITGETNGSVHYTFDGMARSDFRRNRIGFCILHPIAECAGKSVEVTHTDGGKETGAFPSTISPHQPFFDIRAVSYDVMNTGIRAHLEVEGDIFEMEDQRNWTDASFKTYCTPQARPKPHPVKTGDRVQQAVTLRLTGNVRPIRSEQFFRPALLSGQTAPVCALPPLGLCAASHGRPLQPREIERLKALRLAHLRVDVRLDDPACAARLEQAAAEADALGCGLHLALTLGGRTDELLPAFVKHLERVKPKVLLWIILHDSENPTSEQTVARVRHALQKFAPDAPFAAGTRDFFTEINRARPEPDATSLVCYSNNPQVHAYDATTMIENLAGQAHNVETAKSFTSRPVVVSPITLRIRDNANAAAEKPGALQELPSDVDPRQLSLFGAGWTLGSIARLAATDFVHSLTYFETTGWRGVMEAETGPLLPEKFPSEAGAVFPMYHVLADIAEFGEWLVPPVRCSRLLSHHPLLTEGILMTGATRRRRILAANLTGETLRLRIGPIDGVARVRCLDETNAEAAARHPEKFRQQAGQTMEPTGNLIELMLLPYAIARVDLD